MDTFKGRNGQSSSKRIIGSICIFYAMIICAASFFVSGGLDIPANVQVVALQFLIVGGGMITAGVLEK